MRRDGVNAWQQLQKAAQESKASKLHNKFKLVWSTIPRAPELQEEVAVVPDRKYRFDFANTEAKVAIEIQGGIWTKGGHSTGKGILRDTRKGREAIFAGWTLFQVCADDITFPELSRIADYMVCRRNENANS